MPMKSTTERTVKTKFDGDARDGIRAAKAMERELARLDRERSKAQAAFVSQTTQGADKVVTALGGIVKGTLAIGSAASSAQGLAGATAAVVTLSGTALALPGILAGGAAAGGVFALAMSGIGDAIAADDLAEFNELTKDMAPNAVNLAKAVRDQGARFTELKRTVQGRFFAGFDTDVRNLSEKYFPLLNKHSGDIAGEWNAMGREAAKALLDPNAVKNVNTTLGNTTKGLKELRPSLGNVLTGFLDLSAVGSTKMPALGKAVNGLTQDFEDWVRAGVESGKINELIDKGIEEAKTLGRVFGNVGEIGEAMWRGLDAGGADFLGSIEETTQAIEDFFESAEGQETLKTLAEVMGVAADAARNVLKAALEELGPIIVESGPAFAEIAKSIGETLVNAIELVGPLLRNVATFLSDNKDVVGDLVPLVFGLVGAYKGLQVATEVKTWLSGLDGMLKSVGTNAGAASAAIGDEKSKGGLVGRLGGLKLIAGTIALGVVAKELDDLNVSAADGEENLSGVNEQLHNIVGAGQQLLSLDFGGILKDIKAEFGQIRDQFNAGTSPIGNAFNNQKIEMQISVGVDDSQARRDLADLTAEIGRTQESVTINGKTLPAAAALRDVIAAIDAGEGTVNVNGATIDANRALDDIVALINRSAGTVRVDGNDVPAGQVLVGLLNRVNGSRAVIGVDANDSAAQGVVNRFITMNNGRQVDIFVNARGDAGGLASAGRLATGGRPFFDGRVSGPGGRTDDRAGLYRLSDYEHVWSAADVEGAGGHGAMYRMRALARQGLLRGFADGGTPAYLTTSIPAPSRAPSVSVAAPNTTVTVMIDGQRFRGMITTEIENDKREAKRVARSGPGGAW